MRRFLTGRPQRLSPILFFAFAWFAAAATGNPAAKSRQYLNLPLVFESQPDSSQARYIARGQGYRIALGDKGATLEVRSQRQDGPAAMVTMKFSGSRVTSPTASQELPGKVNHIHGSDPERWRLGLPTYGRVTYSGIYRGIDAVFYGNQQQLEFDLALKPGADPRQVRMAFDGARRVWINPAGELELDTAAGPLRLALPAIYQTAGGARKNIAGGYKLLAHGEVGFIVGAYDRTRELVIDPSITYSTLLGGSTSTTTPQAIAVDVNGNAFIAGYTYAADFPITQPAISGQKSMSDGFVTAMNASGTALIYSTYIGGSGNDQMTGIAVDSSGAAWVSGTTSSKDFPLMSPYQSMFTGTGDAVALKLSSSGALQYSTYLGGTSQAAASGIAVDGSKNAYVTGNSGAGFPTTAGVVSTTTQGGFDAFVVKFTSGGSLVYSTYLGGTSSDYGTAIAVDGNGNAYITGNTDSSSFAHAPGGGAQTTNHGGGDAFVAKLNSTGTALMYFTFVGGTGPDHGAAIAVDAGGNAYIGGNTSSADFGATASAYQTAIGGNQDGFVAKLNSTGSAFLYKTYLGGKRMEQLYGLALDSGGNVYVTGNTQSNPFPLVSPLFANYPGNGVSIFQSTNSGSTWSAFDANLPSTANDLSPNPANANLFAAATGDGIYLTSNNGGSWTLVYEGYVNSLSRSPASTNTIYGSDGNVVLTSTDGGSSWQNLAGIDNADGSGIVADPLSASTAYVFTYSSGVYKTTDGGKTLNPANTGLPSLDVLSMAAASDGSLYVSLYGDGIYKSTNHAASWTPANTGLSLPFYGQSLAVSHSNPSVLYVNDGSIHKTTNAGGMWTDTTGNLPSYTTGALAVSPINPSVVYAAVNYSPSVVVSTDGGATWSPAAAGLGANTPFSIIPHPSSNGRLFALTPSNTTGFISKLNASGSALLYSTYFGSTDNTIGRAVASKGSSDAFVTGVAYGEGSFPTTPNAFQTSSGTSSGGFVLHISDATPACSYTVEGAGPVVYGSEQFALYDVIAPSGCAWTASSNQTWATVVQGLSGTGAGTIVVHLAENITGGPRSVILTIGGQQINVTQQAINCGYTVTPGYVSANAAGGNVQVNVKTAATCDWRVTNFSPDVVALVSGGAGPGNGSVTLSIGPNDNTTTRHIVMKAGPAYFYIDQAGPETVANDEMGGATNIGTLPYATTEDTKAATPNAGDPVQCYGGQNSATVWFKWAAAKSGSARVYTQGSSYRTILSIFQNTTANVVGCSGPSGSGKSDLTFMAAAGQTYLIEVASYGSNSGGSLVLNVTQHSVPFRDYRGIGRSDALIYDAAIGQSYTGLSNGNGSYQYVPNLFSPGFDTLRTGDFNGDGKSDLVLYNTKNATAYIGFGNGDGTFNFQSLFWSPAYDRVETGDLNGDGKTDVALYNSSTGTLYAGISNGDGTFTYYYHLVSMGFTFVRLADFTGDGKADLFLYNAATGGAYVGIGDGSGGFSFHPLFVSPGYNLADVGDLNGDGKADVILYNGASGSAATGISDGSGGFAFTPLPFSPGFTAVRLADYTGDGKADVAVYNKNTAVAYFGTGTGSGGFNFQSLFWSPGYDSVEAQDANSDGKLDIVLYNSATGTEYTGISNGDGTFTYAYDYWGIGKMLAR